MLTLNSIFGNILKSKKTETVTIKNNERTTPYYGDDLFCARYYNSEETEYVDLYIPLKGSVGIWISGGADSSLLAFLLAKTIKDYKLDIKILPMTFKRDNKPWNLAVSTNVVEQIEKILEIEKGKIFLSHNYCYLGNHELVDEFSNKMHKHIDSLKRNGLINLVYSGLSKNPDPLPAELVDDREISRDDPNNNFKDNKINYNEEKLISNPFMFLTKEFIADLYKKYDLLDSLLPYTRSCEGFMKNTNFFKETCQTCWWCRERKWAFAKYTEYPLKHIPPSNKMKKMCSVV